MNSLSFNKLVRETQEDCEGFIPVHRPVFMGNEKKYLNNTIDSTFVSSVGKYVSDVEEFVVKYSDVSNAVATVNGTAALEIALKILGVKPGEEVITQALTFVATANAVAYNGAAPVFIDVDLDTMGMSPIALENFLNDFAELRGDKVINKKTGRRIAAVLPMHTFGFLCRIKEIQSICLKWNLPLVEDSAEALGSFKDEESAGSFGQVGTFSFNGNKIVTAGGGGLIVTNNEKLAQHSKYLTTTAKKPHPYEFFHDELGYNYRMPNLNAALLLAQLERLNDYRDAKALLYDMYNKELPRLGLNLVPVPDSTTKWNYWLMAVQFDTKLERDIFLRSTLDEGVGTRPIWNLMYRLPMYSKCQRDEQKNAEFLEERIVNIPSSVIVKNLLS